MAKELLRGHQPPWCAGCSSSVRIISESEQLAQGVAGLTLGVLSLLAVDESFSIYPKTLGSRAPRLYPGEVCCGQLYAWTQAPEAGLSLRPHSPLKSNLAGVRMSAMPSRQEMRWRRLHSLRKKHSKSGRTPPLGVATPCNFLPSQFCCGSTAAGPWPPCALCVKRSPGW